MRHGLSLITFLFIAGLAVGCGSTDGQSPTNPDEQRAGITPKAEGETKQALGAAQDDDYANRAETVGRLEKELGEIERELNRHSAKVAKAGAAAKADTTDKLDQQRVDELQARHQSVQSKLDQLKAAGGDKLATFKDNMESTWTEVELAFQKREAGGGKGPAGDR